MEVQSEEIQAGLDAAVAMCEHKGPVHAPPFELSWSTVPISEDELRRAKRKQAANPVEGDTMLLLTPYL